MTGSDQQPVTQSIVRAAPPFPKGGSAVKAELDRVCPIIIAENGMEISTCPAIDAWHARLWVFEQQLGVTR